MKIINWAKEEWENLDIVGKVFLCFTFLGCLTISIIKIKN